MNKKSLKRYGLGIVGLMCLLMGCSQEQPIGNPTPPTGKPVEVRLLVNAPLAAAVPNEDNIKRLRLVVFGSAGASDEGALIVNKYYPTFTAGNILKEVITSGKRDIYLIANEPLAEGGGELDDYKKIATVADVHRLKLVYQGAGSADAYVPSEIPMCVEHLNKQIKEEATNIINGTVERTMAKVTLNLNIKDANFPAGKQVVIDHITIKNLPSFSYLIAKNYTEALVNSEEQKVSEVPATGGYDFSSTNTFYVPEYLFDDPDQGAYIEIIGHVNGEPDRTTKYTVKLGDAMDDGKRYGDKYHITRNHHYIFTGDVISYGETNGVAVTVTVAPWNTVNMGEEVGRYIAFGKVTYVNTSNEIAEGANLDDMGTTLTVECSTNTGGWYTVTKDAKGAIVHQSAATPSVSTVMSQAVDIPIPRIGELPYLQSYTVSIYHPTIAQVSVGPIKALNFTQYGGFIPTSVLKAAKWPTQKLPPNGLQLAKRGDRILPSGMPGADDPRMAWKTSFSSTPGTAVELGMGASSTVAMTGAEHPAAQYCRDMGEGWFLPSQNELLLIYANRSTLGASYPFYAYYYWSSSEYSNTYGRAINLLDGTMYYLTDKKFEFRVRCIRAI